MPSTAGIGNRLKLPAPLMKAWGINGPEGRWYSGMGSPIDVMKGENTVIRFCSRRQINCTDKYEHK